jgi:hypothetical protein
MDAPGLLVLISGISNTTMKCHGNSARNLDFLMGSHGLIHEVKKVFLVLKMED